MKNALSIGGRSIFFSLIKLHLLTDWIECQRITKVGPDQVLNLIIEMRTLIPHSVSCSWRITIWLKHSFQFVSIVSIGFTVKTNKIHV